MAKLKTNAAALVARARARIDEMTAAELIARRADPDLGPDLVIVDIRDIRELQRSGFIAGSVHAPRGMLEFWVDPESPYYKDVFGQDGKTYVLHCASGWRSALSAEVLNDMGFACAHVSDGFTGWRDAGGPIEMSEPWNDKGA